MTVLSFLFFLFMAYLAYRVVFHFILPIYRTTRQVKRGFREMQERMQQGAGPSAAGRSAASAHTADTKGTKSPAQNLGEYIDFEEVK